MSSERENEQFVIQPEQRVKLYLPETNAPVASLGVCALSGSVLVPEGITVDSTRFLPLPEGRNGSLPDTSEELTLITDRSYRFNGHTYTIGSSRTGGNMVLFNTLLQLPRGSVLSERSTRQTDLLKGTAQRVLNRHRWTNPPLLQRILYKDTLYFGLRPEIQVSDERLNKDDPKEESSFSDQDESLPTYSFARVDQTVFEEKTRRLLEKLPSDMPLNKIVVVTDNYAEFNGARYEVGPYAQKFLNGLLRQYGVVTTFTKIFHKELDVYEQRKAIIFAREMAATGLITLKEPQNSTPRMTLNPLVYIDKRLKNDEENGSPLSG